MTARQWQAFSQFRTEFKDKCDQWLCQFSKELVPLQKKAAVADTPEYSVETPIVYNIALDEVTESDEIRLIVIGDNPGKTEQLSCNRRYLVGQSGKIAQGFFSANKSLGIDFRKNTIILNKTPVHTAKTSHLKYLQRQGSLSVVKLIEESQIWMARKTAQLHQGLACENSCLLWLVGYGELKEKGVFKLYRDALFESYRNSSDAFWQQVFVFQHFSMNRFLIDLKNHMEDCKKNATSCCVEEALKDLGATHRKTIFGV